MSSTDGHTGGDDIPQSVYERLDALESELEAKNERVDQLEARVDELETQNEETATVEWDGPNPGTIEITASETGNSVAPYAAITKKVDSLDFQTLKERVDALENGEVDIVVRGETDRDALPIENRIARRKAEDGSLTANEYRASLVFPKFGKHADSWSGKLKLTSKDVRTILERQTGRDSEEWNYNTIKRTMRHVAKLTSSKGEDEPDPRDEDNLITLRKGEKRLELIAEKDEWNEFCDEAAGE